MPLADESNSALLLLDPTGSGKTPLGEWLDDRRVGGRQCLHFDFGQQLRVAASRIKPPSGLSEADLFIIRRCLATQALLEDHEFPIAAAILRQFMTERPMAGDGLLVLNGLPRHTGQARDVDRLLDVRVLIVLECDAAVIHARIAGNTGGDRTCRVDDDRPAIERKLVLYRDRTQPLIDHYRQRGARVVEVSTVARRRWDSDCSHAGRRSSLERWRGWNSGANAGERTRTSTGVSPPEPKSGASANFATPAVTGQYTFGPRFSTRVG